MPQESAGPLRDRSSRILLPMREQLVGTWLLRSYTLAGDAGVEHPLGRDAAGLLVVAHDGYLACRLLPAHHPVRGAGSFACAGAFEVDESGRLRVTPPHAGPAGSVHEASCALDGDLLLLTGHPVGPPGRRRVPLTVWRRASTDHLSGR